jgi:beta-N-acetylhexosaminidase
LPPLDFAKAAGNNAAQAMYLRYRLIAAELFDLGIDSNCAPMVDLATEDTHPFLLDRCYGSQPDQVASLGRAAADGLLNGGVLPVVKHIPGHGRTLLDSHYDLPQVSAEHGILSVTDFAPFKALNDLPMGMTAHLVYDALDSAPATLSGKVMSIVRNEIGFDGLVMTDDISMKALRGSLIDISRTALEAGCDVILHCNGSLDARREVAEAAGEMNDQAQSRAERVLSARKTPDDIDISAAEAQLETLLNGA